MTQRSSSARCALFVHAHPDDETTKGGGTAALLAAQGVRTVLVTCTDGAAGDVTDEALLKGRPLAAVRSDELAAAVAIMGFAGVHELGYPDSGSESEVEGGFASRAVHPLTDRLAEIIRAEAPDIVITYEREYAKGHPDHLRCHDISAAAFAQVTGRGHGPGKLYGSSFFSRARVQAMHDWMNSNELKSPYEKVLATLPQDQFTTRIAIGEHALTARRALQEHRTQIAHDNRWFYSIPDESLVDLYPWEEFQLLAVGAGVVMPAGLESDLFAGL